ncbi:MAG: phytanoyl-CoA dioxygenase family protein, partial [Acidimicrobiia bacterium]|nr:phytanoyl-CoA dioxygenase family protein [Acidimicrobiia bacterium]
MGAERTRSTCGSDNYRGRVLDTNATATDHVAAIARDGFTIVPDAIEATLLDELTADLEQLEAIYEIEPSPNVFEGAHTKRVYNLLALSPAWQQVPVHARVLPIVEGVLDAGCLVSSLSSIRIMPEETAQPIHADDQLMPLAKPHVPTVCNTMWALTDFTDA